MCSLGSPPRATLARSLSLSAFFATSSLARSSSSSTTTTSSPPPAVKWGPFSLPRLPLPPFHFRHSPLLFNSPFQISLSFSFSFSRQRNLSAQQCQTLCTVFSMPRKSAQHASASEQKLFLLLLLLLCWLPNLFACPVHAHHLTFPSLPLVSPPLPSPPLASTEALKTFVPSHLFFCFCCCRRRLEDLRSEWVSDWVIDRFFDWMIAWKAEDEAATSVRLIAWDFRSIIKCVRFRPP